MVKLEAIIPYKQVEEPVHWSTESLIIECHKGHPCLTCVGTHKTSISCTDMSSKCME
jgi:hypothetical protein